MGLSETSKPLDAAPNHLSAKPAESGSSRTPEEQKEAGKKDVKSTSAEGTDAILSDGDLAEKKLERDLAEQEAPATAETPANFIEQGASQIERISNRFSDLADKMHKTARGIAAPFMALFQNPLFQKAGFKMPEYLLLPGEKELFAALGKSRKSLSRDAETETANMEKLLDIYEQTALVVSNKNGSYSLEEFFKDAITGAPSGTRKISLETIIVSAEKLPNDKKNAMIAQAEKKKEETKEGEKKDEKAQEKPASGTY